MIILGIETSCDETAISVIESKNGTDITVLADKTLSQIELHKQYGGVFPTMAKREHAKNLLPLLKTVLNEAGFLKLKVKSVKLKVEEDLPTYNLKLATILEREPELLEQFLEYVPTIKKPPLDAIAVTEGPGLEPCLWTGINLAKALSLVWDIPIVPVNHMEGHIFSSLLRRKEISNSKFLTSNEIPNSKTQISNELPKSYQLSAISYPSLALLISGGHTELVLIKGLHDYEIIGQTRDDAVGEAFDKVARLLGLPYPGGPEISRLAEELRSGNDEVREDREVKLPRPMIYSKDFDFSFSGIKTSVLYLLKRLEQKETGLSEKVGVESALSPRLQKEIALEFENAVTEVLVAKTKRALEQYGAGALLLGGGVIANTHIRREFEKLAKEQGVTLHVPDKNLTTDNALMIAVTGLMHSSAGKNKDATGLRARGNLRLDNTHSGKEYFL